MGVTALEPKYWLQSSKYMKSIKTLILSFLISLPLLGANFALATVTAPLDGLKETGGQIPAYNSQTGDTRTARESVLDKIGGIVGLILSFLGVIFLGLTVFAGFLWMTAQGNNAKVERAKDLLINAVIGLIIIVAAYSITLFIGRELT
jgi:hypothetical protein